MTDRFGDDQRYDAPAEGCVLSNGLLPEHLARHWRPLARRARPATRATS